MVTSDILYIYWSTFIIFSIIVLGSISENVSFISVELFIFQVNSVKVAFVASNRNLFTQICVPNPHPSPIPRKNLKNLFVLFFSSINVRSLPFKQSEFSALFPIIALDLNSCLLILFFWRD